MTVRPQPSPVSPLPVASVRASTVFYALAAITGIPGVVLLLSPDYTAFLLQDLATGGITDPSSLHSWRIIQGAVSLLACIGPAILAGSLSFTLRGKPVRGLGFLSGAAQITLYGVTISGGLAVPVFLFRFVRFLIVSSRTPDGLMLIYSMLISEALMVTQAAFLFVLIRKFLNCSIDSATSIAYTLATGKADTRSISGFPAVGLTVLSIVGIVLAITRVFTVTIIRTTIASYFKLLVTSHPALIIEAICLLLGAVANLLLAHYLRCYKRNTEQLLFQSRLRS